MQNIEHTYTNPPNDSTHTSLHHHHHHYHHPLHLFSITQHPNKPLKQQSHSKYEGSNIKAMPNTMHNTKDNIFLHPCFFLLPSSSFSLNHPPPRAVVERIGIVGSNGFMSDSLKFGDFDDELVDKLIGNVAVKECEKKEIGIGVGVEKYEICDVEMVDVIPNLDCNLSDKEMKFERHCPEKGKMLNCLVPIPVRYRNPIPWPQSRDEVWYSNIPHTCLVENKGGQNWISIKGDKFVFPGGGTQFIHGADLYLDQISQMVPEIKFGQNMRVALNIGCGVASFGAFSLQHNVTTLCIAPKDVHENQVQFAFERGVPAMVALFATHRLLYPSRALLILLFKVQDQLDS